MGLGHRMVLVDTEVAWPNGLTVDWQDMELYWTDAKANVIEAIGLDGLNRRIVIAGKVPGKKAGRTSLRRVWQDRS